LASNPTYAFAVANAHKNAVFERFTKIGHWYLALATTPPTDGVPHFVAPLKKLQTFFEKTL
jgi:hypothetical protein